MKIGFKAFTPHTQIAFDLYERYSLTAAVACTFRLSGREAFSILDVGGSSPVLWPGFTSLIDSFVPGSKTCIVDTSVTPGLLNAVSASGTALPFADDSFDVVCSLDTLEHVPPDQREPFLRELLRVTRDGLFLSFPVLSEENVWAEQTVDNYLEAVLQSPIPQLREHAAFGLPESSDVREFFQAAGVPFTEFGHGNTDIWLLAMMTSHTLRVQSEQMLEHFNRRFNTECAPLDWKEPTYRVCFLASKRRPHQFVREVAESLRQTDGALVEHQPVFALCQLFLSLSQNARVSADKDRHIRNLETQVAAYRTFTDELKTESAAKDTHIRNIDALLAQAKAEISSVHAAVRSFEAAVVEFEAAAGIETGAIPIPLVERITQLRRSFDQLQAESAAFKRYQPLLDEQSNCVHQLEQAVQHVGEQFNELETSHQDTASRLAEALDVQHSFQRSTQSRLTTHDAMLARIDRRVQEILHSRIWRTLTRIGGVALRLAPRAGGEAAPPVKPAASALNSQSVEESPRCEGPILDASRALAGLEAPPQAKARPTCAGKQDTSPPEHTAPFDPIEATSAESTPPRCLLRCDEPLPEDTRPRSGEILIRGWALYPPGIDAIEVQVGDCEPLEAKLGLPRPDVKQAYGDLDSTGRAGFAAHFDSLAVPSGDYTVAIRIMSGGKPVRETITSVHIDHASAYADDYHRWIEEVEKSDIELLHIKTRNPPPGPLFSIVMPTYDAVPAEMERAIASVQAQTYPYWELCAADDGSSNPKILEILARAAAEDQRIKTVFRQSNGGISAASNSALELVTGDYIALLDHDDELAPHALAAVYDTLRSRPRAELLYSDEDKLDSAGRRYDPFFKPDWAPDLLLSANYICHLLVLKRSLLERVGSFRSMCDGSQDYDLVLRATGMADEVVHIPRVLYHWRASLNSTASEISRKDYVLDSSQRALEDWCREHRPGARVEPGRIPGRWRIRYPIPEGMRVSIVIASGGNVDVLRKNLESLIAKTDYQDYEIVIIDNSKHDRVKAFVDGFYGKQGQLRYIDWRHKPFNYSVINNTAARQCESPILLFLNDDTSVITPDWLTSMVELIARPEVGVVGAKLLYPDGRIQHAGVVMGLYENCGHAFKGQDGMAQHYFDLPDVIRNVSAVTGACLMTRSQLFWKAGGFDETSFAVAFNDIDLCLKIGQAGYRVLYTPHAVLYHHEAFSKTKEDLIPHPAEVATMQKKWSGIIEHDPYYSPNLTRADENYAIR